MPHIPHKAAKNTEGCVIFKGMLSDSGSPESVIIRMLFQNIETVKLKEEL